MDYHCELCSDQQATTTMDVIHRRDAYPCMTVRLCSDCVRWAVRDDVTMCAAHGRAIQARLTAGV